MRRRRALLRIATGAPLGLAGFWQAGCNGATPQGPVAPDGLDPGRTPTGPLDQAVAVPKVNGAINIHPLRCLGCPPDDDLIDDTLVALQLRAVYELGFDGIRITAPLGDRHSLLAALPYVRIARALGIDALVVISDFSGGLTTAHALGDDGRRAAILRTYALRPLIRIKCDASHILKRCLHLPGLSVASCPEAGVFSCRQGNPAS